jgi:DNA repair protein RadD
MLLRPYQADAIEDLRLAYRHGKRAPLLVMPTGAGKTVVFTFVTHSHVQKGGRVAILVHRVELVEQVVATLRQLGLRPGVVSPDYPYEPRLPVQVCSVATLYNRLSRFPPPTLAIADECHHVLPKTRWGKIFSAWPNVRRLGVTATPIRLDGSGLNAMFDDLILGPSTSELIDLGALAPVTVYAPKQPDLSSIPKRHGDYATSALVTAMDRPTITGDCLDHYQRLANGKQAVVFCVSVEHAQHVAQQFMAAGHTALSIDGGTHRDLRARIIRDFRDRTIRVLTSCDLISEGFDCPGIDVGISLRPTASLALYLQQVGRCLRPAPDKSRALLLDHAGNTHRHGLPTEPRAWSLAGTRASGRNATERDPATTVRICPHCFAASRAGSSACGACQRPFPVEARKVAHKKGELEEVDPRAREARREQGKAQGLEALIELGRIRGYRNARTWAEHVWAARQKKRQA